MKYEPAPDLQKETEDIAKALFPHVRVSYVKCFRSYGTSSRGTIARCHTIGKLMQLAIGVAPYYAIEFIVERFEKMSDKDKKKVIIHELMHIPKAFGGGFIHHDKVNEKNVNIMYEKYCAMKKNELLTEGYENYVSPRVEKPERKGWFS